MELGEGDSLEEKRGPRAPSHFPAGTFHGVIGALHLCVSRRRPVLSLGLSLGLRS